MMRTRWFFFVLVLLAAKLFVWVTAGFWARASVKHGWTVLPGRWAWLHPADDDLDGGQHQLGWPVVTGKALSRQRAEWLRRNPAWGVSAYLLGFPAAGTVMLSREQHGAFDLGSAKRTARMICNGKQWFEYRRDLPWFPGLYAKLWFGWNSEPKVGWHSLELEINPFRRRRK